MFLKTIITSLCHCVHMRKHIVYLRVCMHTCMHFAGVPHAGRNLRDQKQISILLQQKYRLLSAAM